MTEGVEDEQERLDRHLKEAEPLEDDQMADPLTAVKALRLEQLAVCRIKTADEIQKMHDKSSASKINKPDQE